MSTTSEFILSQTIQQLDWTTGLTKHDQTYRAFLSAARAGLPADLTLELVVAHLKSTGAILNERDILRQLSRAYEFVAHRQAAGAKVPAEFLDGKRVFFQPADRLPKFSHAKLRASASRVSGPVDAAWLKSRSTVWPATWSEYLGAIYQLADRILVFSKLNSPAPCAVWPDDGGLLAAPVGDDGVWYLCNPVHGQRQAVQRCQSKTNPGGLTYRSAECITSFRYMVLESDHKDENFPGVSQDWLKFMTLLPLRIVALYTTAGKSIHALVQLDAVSKVDWDNQVRAMKPFLVEHGADSGALRAVQLTRLPYAYRQGRRQELLYCNPDADGTPIIELPTINEGGQRI